ncbi:hypothetical protein MKX01_041956, partial [Papaver californicum]
WLTYRYSLTQRNHVKASLLLMSKSRQKLNVLTSHRHSIQQKLAVSWYAPILSHFVQCSKVTGTTHGEILSHSVQCPHKSQAQQPAEANSLL